MFWGLLIFNLWVFWLAVYWRGGLEIIASIRAANTPRDRFYLIALTAITALLLLSIFMLSIAERLSVQTAIPGGALVAYGIGGTFYSRGYLGRYWTAENTLQADHRIVESGPYAYVRHPIYTTAIVIYIGTGIAFPTWWNIILVALAVLIYVLKTVHEDQFLSDNLAGYADYQQRVPHRLIPSVW